LFIVKSNFFLFRRNWLHVSAKSMTLHYAEMDHFNVRCTHYNI